VKVLVAEDDEDQLSIRCLLLSQAGFLPLGAQDIATALALADSEKPDCAVVDLRFPSENDGFQLLEHLKAANPRTYNVVLTGADPARLEKHPRRYLMDEVIVKGSSAQRLLETLRAFERSVA
jgi:DNA-binding response OmpR family regulator